MAKNLVIVESPAKAKTIEGFLGKDFKVKSSMGHVRDLTKEKNGVDIENNFKPMYEVSPEKKDVVKELKKLADESEMVWLASDEDREGEAISWHLKEVLKLKPEKTKRIVFHEITKPAILKAIENPRSIDEHLVDAQQARRILDRLVGFELSPILWKKVKPSLSAGRVQSVAVRLIVEREREIKEFQSESFYKIAGIFEATVNGKKQSFKAELPERFSNEETALSTLEKLIPAQFSVASLEKKPLQKNPAPPFTTSTLQQEASKKLRFPVARTMSLAQKLYEGGHITYMRTDSTNLSELALQTAKDEITSAFGAEFSKTRQFKTKSASAQEAHEAIRPTYFSNHTVKGSADEVALYQLIWKRAIASQMSPAEIEKTIIKINTSTLATDQQFVAEGEVIRFEGFLKVYLETSDDEEDDQKEGGGLLPAVVQGDALELLSATGKQGFTRAPARYNEAALVKKMEELGIGRPSTYAPTISTIQQRGYVERSDLSGTPRTITTLTLQKGDIKKSIKEENTGADKGKLIPTDIGILVNDFLIRYFDKILDFKFTAKVEEQFDQIAEGKLEYEKMLSSFYGPFHQNVSETLDHSERVTGERILGFNAEGKQVSVRMSRFGPVAQLTDLKDEEAKPQYANLPKGLSLEEVNLDQAITLFGLPKDLGEYEGKPMLVNNGRYGPYVKFGDEFVSLPKGADPYSFNREDAIALLTDTNKLPREIGQLDGEKLIVNKGRFGPYVKYKSNFVSLKKGMDPLTITESEAITLIREKMEAQANALIAEFSDGIQILIGRYGPYIKKGKDNFKIPKGVEAKDLTEKEVLEIVAASSKPAPKKKATAKK